MPGSIRLGIDSRGRALGLDPFAPRHTVLTGATRSGKSVQLYNMIVQLRGLPVTVCGIDPSGIVFNALDDALGGSAWRVSTLRDTEKARDVMDAIVEEMDRRIDLLLKRKLDKIDDFDSLVPLLVVVLEEYPGTLAALAAADQAAGLKPADRIEPHIRAAIQRLALEGAKVGVRLWIVAQRADASLLTGVLRSQLTQRLSFRQDADGVRMLHDGITPDQIQAMQTFRPGVAYAEYAGELPLTLYRADLISYADFVRAFE